MELILAPMRGITNVIFRNVYSKYFTGFDRAIAPFIATCSGKRIRPTHFKDLLPDRNLYLPIIPQLLSNNSNDFVRMSQKLTDIGYNQVNWNLGCPKKTVTKKKRGAGLLPYPTIIDNFLDNVLTNISPIKLSVKIRLGLHDSNDILELIPIFNKYPLSEIIIHPRTGYQEYKGVVDLSSLDKIITKLNHKIVYSGDIVSKDNFNIIKERFPEINSWMIGRGVLINPFLPQLISDNIEYIPDNATETVKLFHDDILNEYKKIMHGPAPVLGAMKELWSYLYLFFKDSDKAFKKIKKQKSIDSYSNVVNNFFENAAVNKF